MHTQYTVDNDTRQQFAKLPSGSRSILFAVSSIPTIVTNAIRDIAGASDIVIVGTRNLATLAVVFDFPYVEDEYDDDDEEEGEGAVPAPHALE
jgi:hypothetical protein